MILHITTRDEWENAQTKGEYIAPTLLTDGFIHCSTIEQTVETANLFFKGRNGLVLLCIDENKLKHACKFEDPAGVAGKQIEHSSDALFPHIYGPVNNSAVINVIDFPPDEKGFFTLPGNLK